MITVEIRRKSERIGHQDGSGRAQRGVQVERIEKTALFHGAPKGCGLLQIAEAIPPRRLHAGDGVLPDGGRQIEHPQRDQQVRQCNVERRFVG